jgi:hypothetical protein
VITGVTSAGLRLERACVRFMHQPNHHQMRGARSAQAPPHFLEFLDQHSMECGKSQSPGTLVGPRHGLELAVVAGDARPEQREVAQILQRPPGQDRQGLQCRSQSALELARLLAA